MPTIVNDKLISWATDVDPGTIRQAEKTARLPIVAGHVALMPDAHVGIGATVGSVIPTKGAVIPAAVGVDIGCGMVAAELDVADHQLPDSLLPLLSRIERAIPAGVGKGHGDVGRNADRWLSAHRPATELGTDRSVKAAKQFGTLGAGNHFFELCLDERGRVWVVLHSGSRGIGNQLAQMHIGRARRLAKDLQLRLEDPDLAYFLEGTPEFNAYIADMLWAQEYARANRDQMMDNAMREVFAFLGFGRETRRINCFAGETRVLTRDGRINIEDLAGGTHELLTAGGEWVKAPVRSFGRQRVVELRLSRSGVMKTIRCTPDHRWLTRTRRGRLVEKTTAQLVEGDRLACIFPTGPAATHDPRGIVRGFVFGDGSARPSRSVANFCGEEDRALLPYFAGLGFPPRTYGDLTRIHGLPCEWKTQMPSVHEPRASILGWLAGYFAADGDVGQTGRPTLASRSREDLEHVRDLCTEVGIGTFGVRVRYRTGFGTKPTALYLVGLMRGDLTEEFFVLPHHRANFIRGRAAHERRGWNVTAVEDAGESAEVFCAVVDGTHCFALEDNILTGNCHHNFTQREVHGGVELWITRKGAIKAGVDDLGVIPGSMGTRSYIVRGKGSAASWLSCSHGAGRRHSRTQAKKLFSVGDLAAQMEGKVWLSHRAAALLDEIPSAYKDIDQVMADQVDLVEVLHTLHQVLNYKGA